MNAPNSNDFECIARYSDAEAAKAGRSHGPVLKGYGRPQGNSYCY
jgi:hypothetical protein